MDFIDEINKEIKKKKQKEKWAEVNMIHLMCFIGILLLIILEDIRAIHRNEDIDMIYGIIGTSFILWCIADSLKRVLDCNKHCDTSILEKMLSEKELALFLQMLKETKKFTPTSNMFFFDKYVIVMSINKIAVVYYDEIHDASVTVSGLRDHAISARYWWRNIQLQGKDTNSDKWYFKEKVFWCAESIMDERCVTLYEKTGIKAKGRRW